MVCVCVFVCLISIVMHGLLYRSYYCDPAEVRENNTFLKNVRL